MSKELGPDEKVYCTFSISQERKDQVVKLAGLQHRDFSSQIAFWVDEALRAHGVLEPLTEVKPEGFRASVRKTS